MNSTHIQKSYIKLPIVQDSSSRPLWSVIIPTHNCANYLKETLDSIIDQDLGPELMEIIVVDDCSTKDDPKEIVKQFGNGRVQFIAQSTNVGKVKNYETGLLKSRGTLIHLLHGDDKVRKGFYKELQSVFNLNQSIGAAFSRTIYIDSKSRWNGITGMIQQNEGIVPDILEKLYVKQRIQTPSMVVKREVYEAIGTFDRRLNCMEDWEMWIRIANTYPIAVTNKVLAEYRTHDSNATNETFIDGTALKTHKLICKIVDSYIKPQIKLNYFRERQKMQFEFIILSYQSRKTKLNNFDKLKFILHSLQLRPNLRSFIRLLK